MEMHNERLTFPNEVLTIDSFLTQYIVLPFWYLCDACKRKPVIVNEEAILNHIYFMTIVKNGIEQQIPVSKLRQYSRIMRSKSPVFITPEKDGFKWKHKSVPNEELNYCKSAFAYRLEKGFITSSDALWMANDIIEHYPSVSKALVMRFPYIIVDEAQDNSELHFEFFNQLKEAGLQNLEFVGDICQSIYGFNNAKPELLQSMMLEADWNVLPLSECRRSNQRIIDLYSKLKSQDVPTITSLGVEDKGVPIVVYKYDDGNVNDIIQDFYTTCDNNNLLDRIILARGTSKCKSLSGVKDVDFKYWKTEQPYLIIDAVFAFYSGDMNTAFRKIRLVLAYYFRETNIDEKRKFLHEIEHSIEWNTRIFGFLKQVPPFSLSFQEWSKQTCRLLQEYWGLEKEPVFIPFKKKDGYKMKEMASISVERYHQSYKKESEFHRNIDTIHAVKGASLDAVLLFLSSDSRGQSVSLNDFPSETIETMTESQRLIYVACSRAKQFLALAVPRSIADEAVRNALAGVDIDIRYINLQGELNFVD